MPIIAGDLSFFMGPQQLGAPDDLLQPILDFIDSARSRQNLMIAIQEVDHPDIADAIIKARLRGVVVDLVMEQSYLLAQRRPASLDEAHEAKGKHEVNRRLFNAILRSTADVKVDFNPSIFHQKFMVLGNRVLTGSTNFTETGVTRNLNHLVVVDDAEVANAFKAEFREIRAGNFGKASVAHGPAPKEARVSGMRIKPLFAPDHAPEMEIMKQILKAKSRIDFAVFTFSKSSGIDDALIAAHRSGISVNGVLDKRQANQKWAAKHTLSDAGVSLSMAQGGAGFGKLHHKLMVIDEDVTVIGSFNYTGPANKSNDENIMVIGDGDETDPAAIALQRSVNAAARAEIDRIISTFGE